MPCVMLAFKVQNNLRRKYLYLWVKQIKDPVVYVWGMRYLVGGT